MQIHRNRKMQWGEQVQLHTQKEPARWQYLPEHSTFVLQIGGIESGALQVFTDANSVREIVRSGMKALEEAGVSLEEPAAEQVQA